MIMPCYNAEPYIDIMLASVYGQIHNNIELICVDDGSTDNTPIKLNAWKNLIEKRGYTMKILHKTNGGPASAISAGLSLMTGEYVCFPDSDDMLMPGYVSQMYDYLETHPYKQWVKCDFFTYAEFDPLPVIFSESYPRAIYSDTEHLLEELLTHRPWTSVWKLMIKTSFFSKCFPSTHLEADDSVDQEYPILLPLSAQEPYSSLEAPLYFYIGRDDGLERSYTNVSYDKAILLFKKKHEMAKKIIKRLIAPEIIKQKWELICDITFQNLSIGYAIRYNEDATKAHLIQEHWDCIKNVLGFDYLGDKLQSNHSILLFNDCALDRIIYTQEELNKRTGSNISEMYKKLQDNPVYLYGAGSMGRLLLPALQFVGVSPVCIWDKGAKSQEEYCGVPVAPPYLKQLGAKEKQHAMVIISIQKITYVKEVENFLMEEGMKNILRAEDVYLMLRAIIAAGLQNLA